MLKFTSVTSVQDQNVTNLALAVLRILPNAACQVAKVNLIY